MKDAREMGLRSSVLMLICFNKFDTTYIKYSYWRNIDIGLWENTNKSQQKSQIENWF